MKIYHSSESIENDLKILNLERQIAIEELKVVKLKYKKGFEKYIWIPFVFKLVKKYSVILLLKRFLK